MGLNVMKWPLRPAASKKYQVKIILHSMNGLAVQEVGEDVRLIVNLKWMGPRGALGTRFGTKQARSNAMRVGRDGAVEWEETFENICAFAVTRDGTLQPWFVSLIACKTEAGSLRVKPCIVGTVSVDLRELVGSSNEERVFMKFPFCCNVDGSESKAILLMSISFMELRNLFEGFESVQKLMAPAIACIGDPMSDCNSDESSIRKGSSLKGLNFKISKKTSPFHVDVREDVKLSPSRNNDGFCASGDESLLGCHDNPFDSDSLEESDVDDYVDEVDAVLLEKSFSYGTLIGANLVAEEVIPFHRDDVVPDADVNIISVHSRPTSSALLKITAVEGHSSIGTDSMGPNTLSIRAMLTWRKRKLSFRSPRSRGEPLLNKAYGEEGGDEIDWDRRQSDAIAADGRHPLVKHSRGESLASSSNAIEVLDFGGELFTVGSWEMRDLVSRDGQVKLSANVFFASFDQRSESAAGESACTALVAVIADWLLTHPGVMPSKAEFDMLIRDGSAEWRNLCEVDDYKDLFPDRHFDLETILKAGVRPLAVNPDRSFVGFFQPKGVEELGAAFDFLKHAMTFDRIWDEIERCGPAVYIVSWNDHFFILRFEEHSCYIIDTLGERLYEGCSQAYILHFDGRTSLSTAPEKVTKESRCSADPGLGCEGVVRGQKNEKTRDPILVGGGQAVCDANAGDVSCGLYQGEGACRQFVKGFFAAIQLREVEHDAKNFASGKSTQTAIYQKLQIEFHYAKALEVILEDRCSDHLSGVLQ